ncbi:hypothetical protein [Longimicrobium sp.]|uniref:hypothetical protein n=1 Tax=Longimicrobium sp. TaxID=2029185 RepID=UPI002CA1B011|nr:hypothetical protein [Longimicrobium sp.]HSU13823.1 hypothetical protein [Longimicrobium sp.]
MHATKTLVAAVAATLSLGACATAGGGNVPSAMYLADGPSATTSAHASSVSASARSQAPTATLHVENYNWMDVVVYAVQGTSRMRLGQVTSMSSADFRIPSRFLAGAADNLRLLVDPIGSTEGYMTDGIVVRGGERVSFNVQNALQFSSLMVGTR